MTVELYTTSSLADTLQISLDSLRKKISRTAGQNYGQNEEIPEDLLKEIIPTYAKPSAKRSIETVEAAQELAKQLDIAIEEAPQILKPKAETKALKSIPISTTINAFVQEDQEEAKAAESLKKDPSRIDQFFRSRILLFIVFISALIWQMEHSANIVIRVSLIEYEAWKITSGILFAFAVQFTALLMTIHSGKKWYLILFAFIEFFINMLYYEPWAREEATMATWSIDLILSAAIAFTIYSYSELFTKQNDPV
jgi:hypothetical protein